MVASFITSPLLERVLVNTEGDRKRESPLSIGSELSLILLHKRLSFVFPVSKVRVRSVVDFCNEKFPPTSRKVFGLRMPGGTLGGSFAGRVIENVSGLEFLKIDVRMHAIIP
jgi:hypothetical protein